MSNNTSGKSASRRQYLKYAAAGSSLTLAGCLTGGGDGSSGTITIGGTIPTSGPYGNIGQNQKKAVELAVTHANEDNDAGEREVEVVFRDTQTDTQEATSVARELLRQENADFLAGNFSSSVALAIGELAQREDVIYTCVGGSNAITGAECRSNTFNAGNSAVMQTSGGLRYVLEQGLGESVYEISADYSWGQSIQNWNETQIVQNADGVEYLGNSFVEFGATDYSQAITDARNSGADIISFNLFASNHVQSARQANEFGLFEDRVCVWPATGIVEAEQIGSEILSKNNFYASAPWYWQHGAGAAKSFSDAFKSEYGDRPLGFSASMYAGIRTTLQAIDAADGADHEAVRDEMEDRELFPQLWGTGERFRSCDHRASIATMTVQGRDPSEVDGQNYYEVINVPDDPADAHMRTCDQTGCSF
ncbi:ABC transporter substrate-binding protein [Halorientalis sp.]|uniref:ABC transporter substrate-binding protein n=1 Tax=Halorientalis sp. TaxID=1931229 RepID=UPI002635C7D7|nr:ABC transporter substrate-binding protein [Halorientalis sp.]